MSPTRTLHRYTIFYQVYKTPRKRNKQALFMWKTTSRDSRFEHEGVCISPAGRRRQSRQFSAPRGSSLRCAKHHTSSKIRGSQRRRLSTHTMTTSLTRTLVFESWRWRKAAVKKRKKQRMLWQRKQKISVTPDHTLQLFLRWLELWWYNAKQSWKSAKRNECFGNQKNKINRFIWLYTLQFFLRSEPML